MVSQKYRWDFIGLSTDEKPTSETSDKVVNGSTYYCSDTSKLYVYCDGTWYERKPLGGGGGGGGSYTAGTGIDITDDTISVDTDTIQTKLTAGNNITISDGTISATDTTYSAFTGTDGTTAGEAGLVPAPATTDAGKFLKADGTWATAGGGGPTVVQTTGTSTTDVMSQNAVTGMIFNDPGSYSNVAIGTGVSTSAYNNVVLGRNAVGGSLSVAIGGGVASALSARATDNYAVAIGANSAASGPYSIALGSGSRATVQGQFDVGASSTDGYNNSNYRLLTGVYDPVNAHDAATKGYVDPTTDSSAPTTATVGRLGQIQIDTTTATAYMCVAVDDVAPAYTWKKITA